MIVGSHTDLLSRQQLITKTTLVKGLVDRRVTKCRDGLPQGQSNEFFPHLLNTISAYSSPVSVYCHMLYAFLQTKLHKTACQLQLVVDYTFKRISPQWFAGRLEW